MVIIIVYNYFKSNWRDLIICEKVYGGRMFSISFLSRFGNIYRIYKMNLKNISFDRKYKIRYFSPKYLNQKRTLDS